MARGCVTIPFPFSRPKHRRGRIDRAAPGVYRVEPSAAVEPTPRGAEMGPIHRRHLYAAACACLALAGARAQAEGIVAERVFPVTGACYGRTYDRAHLSHHPGQVVAGITLSGSSRTLIADRRLRDRIVPELALTLRVVFTDGAVAQGDVGCAEEGGRVARCGRTASCGGDVAVEALPDGRLRLVNDDASGRAAGGIAARPGFSLEGGCPPAGQEGRFVPPDGENRVFVLAPLPAVACAGVNAL